MKERWGQRASLFNAYISGLFEFSHHVHMLFLIIFKRSIGTVRKSDYELLFSLYFYIYLYIYLFINLYLFFFIFLYNILYYTFVLLYVFLYLKNTSGGGWGKTPVNFF